MTVATVMTGQVAPVLQRLSRGETVRFSDDGAPSFSIGKIAGTYELRDAMGRLIGTARSFAEIWRARPGRDATLSRKGLSMALEQAMAPILAQLQAAAAAGETVDGEKFLRDLQDAQGRDMAEEIMTKATTTPGLTPERLLEMRDQALGISIEAWHKTLSQHGRVPDEMMQAICDRLWTAFSQRIDEISAAGVNPSASVQ